MYTNIDQTLVNSLQRLLSCEIGGLYCHAITTEYRTHAHCILESPVSTPLSNQQTFVQIELHFLVENLSY